MWRCLNQEFYTAIHIIKAKGLLLRQKKEKNKISFPIIFCAREPTIGIDLHLQ
jgi:hypothetical protein